MLTITRRLEWDSGHRVLGHEGKCKHLHGHRYVAEITVTAPQTDSIGRVIDFSILKTRIGGWVDNNWDHNILLHPRDPLLSVSMVMLKVEDSSEYEGYREELTDVIGRSPYVMDHGENPTAENMARVLFEVSRNVLRDTPIKVLKVRIYETPNCWADYSQEAQTTADYEERK